MRKFELTNEYITILPGRKLFRIRALIDFGKVKKGETGGFVEKEENLSQRGGAWVSGNACVCGNARVSGNACVCDNARVDSGARVYDNARVFGGARVSGNAYICGDARVSGNAVVYDEAWMSDTACVYGSACVYGNAKILSDACVSGNARVSGGACVSDGAQICRNSDYACVKGFGRENRHTTFFKTKNGDISVVCGCFKGTLQDFRDKVKETHRESKMGKEYLMIADLMEYHFKEGE